MVGGRSAVETASAKTASTPSSTSPPPLPPTASATNLRQQGRTDTEHFLLIVVYFDDIAASEIKYYSRNTVSGLCTTHYNFTKVSPEENIYNILSPQKISKGNEGSGQTKRRFPPSYENEHSRLKNIRIFVFVRMFVFGRIFGVLTNIRPFYRIFGQFSATTDKL